MAKVSVELRNNQPSQFKWKRARITVHDVVDTWQESGRWWKDEVPCIFCLVDTPQGAFLLCLNSSLNEWYAKPIV